MNNPRIRKFLDQLLEEGIFYKILWDTRRDGGDGHSDVFFLAFSGNVKGIRTGILIDYGRDGYGFYLESENVQVEDDVKLIKGEK